MSKKLTAFAFLACLLFSANVVFAQTCEVDNKLPMDPVEQVCCCKEDKPNHFVCKPMPNTNDRKCPGKIVAAGDADYKVKIATQKNETCVCQFIKK